jgi:hypothetical protein
MKKSRELSEHEGKHPEEKGQSDVQKACRYISRAVRTGALAASVAAEAMSMMGCSPNLPEGKTAQAEVAPKLKSYTPEEKSLRDQMMQIEYKRQIIQNDIESLGIARNGAGPKFSTEIDALTSRILKGCDSLEKDGKALLKSVSREVDKLFVQERIDFAKSVRERFAE